MRRALPFLSIVGIIFGIFMIFYGMRKPDIPPIEYKPAESPYRYFVAGNGIIDASFSNIHIGSTYNELIWDVYVKEGEVVKKNSPLFKLDTRSFEALLKETRAELDVTKTNMERQKTIFSFYENLDDKSAVSAKEYEENYFALKILEKEVIKLEAKIERVQTDIEKSTICSPIDALILDVNAKVGQNAPISPIAQFEPLVVLGSAEILHVKVYIDETESWRIRAGASATAFVRGNSSIKIPLKFANIRPYITPKHSLTGDNIEKVDTRVLEVVYEFKKENLPVYIGQQLDVFVEAYE